MDDSPLSIAASAAGILTFISAVIAFVYVRYQILQNGRNEIWSSLEAATLSIEETKSMQHALLPNDERHGAERMKKSLQDLLRIDIDIWKECTLVAGYPNPDEIMAGVLEESDRDVRQPIPQVTLKGIGLCFRSEEPLHRYLKVVDFLVLGSLASLIWGSIKMVLQLSIGITPTLLRWYGVRKEVMKKTQQRNMLRSRIMHQQMLLLHMQVSKSFKFIISNPEQVLTARNHAGSCAK